MPRLTPLLKMSSSLFIDEIRKCVKLHSNLASNVQRTGFDGVEVHGGSGYLVGEFSKRKQRACVYGGSMENRIRFVLEAVGATARRVGEARLLSTRIHGVFQTVRYSYKRPSFLF